MKTKTQISCAVTAQLISNCAADQCLCFRYMDSTIPLLSKSEISSPQPASVVVQPVLYRTWSDPEDEAAHMVSMVRELCWEELYQELTAGVS